MPNSEELKPDEIRTESMVEWLLVVFVNELAKHADLRRAASVAMSSYLDANEPDEAHPAPTAADTGLVDALAHRFWSIHPREIQDMGITREQFYAQEIRALIEAHPAPTAADTERDKLIEYFRGEGYSRFGYNGDVHGWSPAETAINAMRELDGKAPAAADTGGLVERLTGNYELILTNRAKQLDHDGDGLGYYSKRDAEIDRGAAKALAAAREQIAELERRGVETQMLAFKWMEAHDKRADGKPYDFPTTTDVPDTIAALSSAQEQIRVMRVLLTEARAEIDYYADTAREHDLVARIDDALTPPPERGNG